MPTPMSEIFCIVHGENEDDSQQDTGDAADNSEIILDVPGDIVKPGPR